MNAREKLAEIKQVLSGSTYHECDNYLVKHIGALVEIALLADKFRNVFDHYEDCDVEIYHDDEEVECTCGVDMFDDALKAFEEIR